MVAPAQRTCDVSRRWASVGLCLVGAVVVVLRWRFLDVPLERDEGEYAYFGQLILNGGLPYRDAYNMKPPGIYYLHALVLWLFGQTITGVRLAVLTVALANVWLFYRCARSWFPRTAALSASAAFGLLCLNHRMLGFATKAEHYVLLFGLTGLLLGLAAQRRTSVSRWFLAGVACGVATTMKPTGGLFAAYLVWRVMEPFPRKLGDVPAKTLASLAAGVATPWTVVFGGFAAADAMDELWFWTITYARQYAAGVPLAEGLRLARESVPHVVGGAPLLWMLAALGWGTLRGHLVDAAGRGLWSFLVMSVVFVSLGWRFSEHYFLLLVPAVAMGFALATQWLEVRPRLAALAVGGVLALSALQEWVEFRDMSPATVARRIYGRNPFPEAVEIAAYVRNNSRPEDRIAVVGSEPEIYFYAHRKAATGFVYTYPLMESHPFAVSMQEQMIHEIESQAPRFLILVHVPTSWSRQPQSHTAIFEWSAQYANDHYRPRGLVEIFADRESRFTWGEEAEFRHPESDVFLSVFERKTR